MPGSQVGTEQFVGSVEEPAPRTLAERVYRQLRVDIVLGRIPPGTRLRSEKLRQTYSIGISPLREALFRLASDGLVVSNEQKGFQVAPIDAKHVRDTMETRIVIETSALERAIEFGDLSWEASIVASYHKLTSIDSPSDTEDGAETWARYHRDFHMSLIASCRSSWLIHFANLLFDQAERHRMIVVRFRDTVPTKRSAATEHELLVKATLGRKKKEAVKLLTGHYRETANHVIELIGVHFGE
ncbi:MAG: transcriptional regulator [Phyllobacteriaceae bacterium]|nr:transcriptional regulator [Roseovarius sp.]MBA89109.1 transcriptional regulator [Phyllobacteriaceae bacterium]